MRGWIVLAVALLLLLLALPILSLLLRASPATLLAGLRDPVVLQALRLSLVTSAAATLLAFLLGLPMAYLLVTREFRGKRLLEVLLELPIVLPPTVAGIGLLLAFGRSGLAGGTLQAAGITLPFSTCAVILAQLFVATPFFIAAVTAGLREVEPRYREVAMTLGATPLQLFRQVLLPLALPSLLAGSAMAWARALGEFGATITFAGNMPGRTQTMPLAIYTAMQGDMDGAITLAVLLVLVSVAILAGLRLVPMPGGAHARRRDP